MTERRRKGKSELIGGLIYTSPYWFSDNKGKNKKRKNKPKKYLRGCFNAVIYCRKAKYGW